MQSSGKAWKMLKALFVYERIMIAFEGGEKPHALKSFSKEAG